MPISHVCSITYGNSIFKNGEVGFGPLYVGYLKDRYPDRALVYCFLIGVLLLGLGYVFSYLMNDERVRLSVPTLADTLRKFGIPVQGQA